MYIILWRVCLLIDVCVRVCDCVPGQYLLDEQIELLKETEPLGSCGGGAGKRRSRKRRGQGLELLNETAVAAQRLAPPGAEERTRESL